MLVVAGRRPAVAHHVGAYTARDNDVSVNFKQVKFSIQAGKFDVAQRLFEDGALRREMKQRSATLPAGLEASTRAALKRGDTRGGEGARGVCSLRPSRGPSRAKRRPSSPSPERRPRHRRPPPVASSRRSGVTGT